MKNRIKSQIPSSNMKLLNSFENLLSQHELENLLKELDKPVLPSIRINPLKASLQDLSVWCKKYGWNLKAIPYCPTGYWLITFSIHPGHTIEHMLGKFYIQDAASMLPVELFSFSQNSRSLILDMAASPGGKTTHLCSKTFDQNLIIANDSSHARIQALKLILKTWGSVNQVITQLPGSAFGILFPETFDYVLLDAPCSMQGLRSTDRHPVRPISKNEQEGLVRRQIELLESSLHSVKIGGQVVYSTCTLSPEENECVINTVMKRHGNALIIQDMSTKLGIPPALTCYRDQPLHQTIAGAARIWPHTYGTAGFFAALITKDDRLASDNKLISPPYSRSKIILSKPEQKELISFNLHFESFLTRSIDDISSLTHTAIKKNGRFWYLIPSEFQTLLPNLPYQSLGMLVAEETPDGLLPSHEFLSRFSMYLSQRRIILDEVETRHWMQGQDLAEPNSVSGNPYIIVMNENGDFIGRGKCLQTRVRNLLPRYLLQSLS